MRVSCMAVALLGLACELPSRDDSGEGAATSSYEDRRQELACWGDLPVYEVCPCEATLDWSGLTEDFWGNRVDPRAFESIGLVRIPKGESAESVADSICADTLMAADVGGYVEAPAEGTTSITLSENVLETGSVVWVEWSRSRIEVETSMAVLVEVVDDGPATIDVAWPP